MLLAEKVIAQVQYILQQRVHAHKQKEGRQRTCFLYKIAKELISNWFDRQLISKLTDYLNNHIHKYPLMVIISHYLIFCLHPLPI